MRDLASANFHLDVAGLSQNQDISLIVGGVNIDPKGQFDGYYSSLFMLWA